MSKTFPHIVEERPDHSGTRLVLRCAELDGGCGEQVEAFRGRPARGNGHWEGYLEFYRRHGGCVAREYAMPLPPPDPGPRIPGPRIPGPRIPECRTKPGSDADLLRRGNGNVKTAHNPYQPSCPLVAEGEYQGRTAEEINASFQAAYADPEYTFGYTLRGPWRAAGMTPLATQAFVVDQWHRGRQQPEQSAERPAPGDSDARIDAYCERAGKSREVALCEIEQGVITP